MANLSQFLGQEIGVESFGLRQIQIARISHLMGGPETETVGIYLTVSGGADGHIMLMYDPQMAYGFVDMLMGHAQGTTHTLGEMETSALGELGNIVGSSFLNSLADATELTLQPSPPSVMTDMAGALLDIIAADILLTQDEAFVAETSFRAPDRDISGQFYVIPTQDLLRVLLDRKSAA
jgi:chemotaxis protein CheC